MILWSATFNNRGCEQVLPQNLHALSGKLGRGYRFEGRCKGRDLSGESSPGDRVHRHSTGRVESLAWYDNSCWCAIVAPAAEVGKIKDAGAGRESALREAVDEGAKGRAALREAQERWVARKTGLLTPRIISRVTHTFCGIRILMGGAGTVGGKNNRLGVSSKQDRCHLYDVW